MRRLTDSPCLSECPFVPFEQEELASFSGPVAPVPNKRDEMAENILYDLKVLQRQILDAGKAQRAKLPSKFVIGRPTRILS